MSQRTKVFNQPGVVTEGWYWALKSRDVRRQQIKPVDLMGRRLVVYRGEDGKVRAMDGHCRHMGADLSLGRVEGNGLRCFFHNWCYDGEGVCHDIPSLGGPPDHVIKIRKWFAAEAYGLVWIWVGEGAPEIDLPLPPELRGEEVVFQLGGRFLKNCHPNVVMVNAIDEHHFQSVHRLPGSMLDLQPQVENAQVIRFSNQSRIPPTNRLRRFLGRFYKGPLYYDLTYWGATNGCTSFGPDFLRFHLVFALRQTGDGKTEGWPILITRRRKGWIGAALTHAILLLSGLGSGYFARNDTKLFQTIRFDRRTPIATDRSVIAFMHHTEQLKVIDWADRVEPGSLLPPPLLEVAQAKMGLAR